MKRCYKCRQIKSIHVFHRDITRHDGNSNICKDCHRERQKVKRRKAADLRTKLKSRGCIICGYNKDPRALDFHHKEGFVKKRNLSRCRSYPKIIREANKCVVICANCHREIRSKKDEETDKDMVVDYNIDDDQMSLF